MVQLTHYCQLRYELFEERKSTGLGHAELEAKLPGGDWSADNWKSHAGSVGDASTIKGDLSARTVQLTGGRAA